MTGLRAALGQSYRSLDPQRRAAGGDRRRYLFVAMAHMAVAEDGTVGECSVVRLI